MVMLMLMLQVVPATFHQFVIQHVFFSPSSETDGCCTMGFDFTRKKGRGGAAAATAAGRGAAAAAATVGAVQYSIHQKEASNSRSTTGVELKMMWMFGWAYSNHEE